MARAEEQDDGEHIESNKVFETCWGEEHAEALPSACSQTCSTSPLTYTLDKHVDGTPPAGQ